MSRVDFLDERKGQKRFPKDYSYFSIPFLCPDAGTAFFDESRRIYKFREQQQLLQERAE